MQMKSNMNRRRKEICAGISLVTGTLFIVAGILVVALFRSFVHNLIMAEIPLLPDSQVTKAWINPPVRPLLRLYFFNTTNPKGFLRGEKPVLSEVGPYVYEERWNKVGVEWSETGDVVRYKLKKTFIFRQDLSSPRTEDDRVTLPNVPLFASVNQMKHAGRLIQAALSSMLDILRQEVFNATSVRDVVWGYHHTLIKLGNDVLPEEKKLPFDQFGFFVNKNGSVSEEWETMTGNENVRDVAQVVSYGGQSQLDFWSSAQCNAIRGTDGSLFHPGVEKNETLHIFNRDLCQSLPLVFQEESSHHDMTTYRFAPPDNVFGTPDENPYNSCFCPDGHCAPSGVFNISSCQFGSPLVMSWPHFFQADPKLLQDVEGLKPDREKHQFQLDVLPKMGVVMRAAVKSQINLVMEKVEGVRQLSGVRDVIYPILWLHDGLETMEDPGTVSLLQTAVNTPEKARSAMYPVLLVLGVLLILPAIAYIIKKYMYVVESEDQNTELDKVNQNGTNGNGVGNSAFTYDYTSNNGWVDE